MSQQKTKVSVLGAGGAIAHHVIGMLKNREDVALTLFARKAQQLADYKTFAKVVIGDVLNPGELDEAIKGQDVIYANLAGPMDQFARAIVESMEKNGVKRLIFIAALGIYNEIPGAFGKWNENMIGADLVRYRKAADIIEASPLDYTLIRPAWLTDRNEIDYELTQRNEPFKGTEVSRKSVAAYVADLIEHPEKGVKANVGIDKPGTEGDKPAFM